MINGKLIRARRKELGLSQVEVVKRVKQVAGGLSQSSYVAIEKGEAERSKFLPYVCQVLGLRLSDVDPNLDKNIDEDMSAVVALIRTLPKDEQILIARQILDNLSGQTAPE